VNDRRPITSSMGESAVTVAVINAGVSDPSSTRLLADRIAQKSVDMLREPGTQVTVSVIDLAPIAVEIAQSIVSGFPHEKVQAAIERLAAADAIIASTPVYKAAISGLFKSFVDLIDNDLLLAKPVILAATGGTARHAMVVDEQLRPLFAFLRAIPMPTSLYAAPEDWGSPELGNRIARAAEELRLVVRSGVSRQIADDNWTGYRHQFAGNATKSEQTIDDVDFTTDLMRLAAGGRRSD
jgi:FMN reductase